MLGIVLLSNCFFFLEFGLGAELTKKAVQFVIEGLTTQGGRRWQRPAASRVARWFIVAHQHQVIQIFQRRGPIWRTSDSWTSHQVRQAFETPATLKIGTCTSATERWETATTTIATINVLPIIGFRQKKVVSRQAHTSFRSKLFLFFLRSDLL